MAAHTSRTARWSALAAIGLSTCCMLGAAASTQARDRNTDIAIAATVGALLGVVVATATATDPQAYVTPPYPAPAYLAPQLVAPVIYYQPVPVYYPPPVSYYSYYPPLPAPLYRGHYHRR